MKTKRIIVVPYDYGWKEEFQKIKIHLERALENSILAIEHTKKHESLPVKLTGKDSLI